MDENPWRETVRDLFDLIVARNGTAAQAEALIYERHGSFFGRAIALGLVSPPRPTVTAEEVAKMVRERSQCTECSVTVGGDPEPGCCILAITAAVVALLRERGIVQ